MNVNFNYRIVFMLFLFIKAYNIEAQIIVRLWEAEASATANVAALGLIKSAEVRVKNKMGELNTELRKKTPYYGLMAIFNPIFQIDNTITRIRGKLLQLHQINNRVPLLFNRKKRQKTRKYNMYNRYLTSLNTDVGNDFSNNGNLLKTSLEIVSELEEIEKDLDAVLEDLTLSERVFSLF